MMRRKSRSIRKAGPEDTYHFEELDTKAKEKALDGLRDINVDHDWWEFFEEQFIKDGEELGFDIDQMYFSGFSSQGDGACWKGTVDFKKAINDYNYADLKKAIDHLDLDSLVIYLSGHDSHENTMFIDQTYIDTFDLEEYVDLEYNDLVFDLENDEDMSEKEFLALEAKIQKIKEDASDLEDSLNADLEKLLEDVLDGAKNYAREYYAALKKGYYYYLSDEQVAESIIINEYDFNEDGVMV